VVMAPWCQGKELARTGQETRKGRGEGGGGKKGGGGGGVMMSTKGERRKSRAVLYTRIFSLHVSLRFVSIHFPPKGSLSVCLGQVTYSYFP